MMTDAEVMARSLAKLLLAVSGDREELPQACDEARKVLLGYLEQESHSIRQAIPESRRGPYWRP